MWIDTDFSIYSKSRKSCFLSRYTIFRVLLCILLIVVFRLLLRHMQTNGQQLNRKVIKVLNKIDLWCCDKYCEILDNTCRFWLAFLHSLLICSSNVKSLSMLMPNKKSLTYKSCTRLSFNTGHSKYHDKYISQFLHRR